MYDGIEFRGFAQDTVEQLADHAGVPVWNGLTDAWHPTQMLADILTMTEHHDGRRRAASPTASSATDATTSPARCSSPAPCSGMDVRIAAPRELYRPAMSPALAHRRWPTTSGARVLVTDDVRSCRRGG